MIAPDLATAISKLRGLIEGANRIVPFTGAGISTECGIPDFRSPGGLWTQNRPIPFDEFIASGEMRDESWRRRFVLEESFAKAKPGRGHRALASLYRAGKVPALVTQNIDNLHQNSGILAKDIVELHGNTTYALCLDCDKRYELSWVREKFDAGGHAPDCACGGYIKTATVSFGQAMPVDEMRRAEQLALSCDLFLAVGSSLVVWPAAGFPLIAKRNGASLVIISIASRPSSTNLRIWSCASTSATRSNPSPRTDSQGFLLCTDLCASTFCTLRFKARCYLQIIDSSKRTPRGANTVAGRCDGRD